MQVELENNDMQFEYDPERLIEEVKKRPGIWDFEDAEYRAKNMRHKLWNAVITELMDPNIKVSKSEMRELELQLQKKWKSIRDCFQKYITNPSRTKRPYIYSKQLQFLIKNHEPTQIERDGSSESDDTNKVKVGSWKFKKRLNLSKNVEQSSDDEIANDSFDNHEESRDYCTEGVEVNIPAKIPKLGKPDDFVFANVDAQIKPEADDPDRLFLLSLLPHIKSIPEEFRLNVKMKLMQVLRNANYSSARDPTII